jgi:hypothetical protein
MTMSVAIFGRLIQRENSQLTPDVARYLLAIDFSPEDRERMDLLAAKAREGTMTGKEQEEINDYELVGHLLSILKSKARMALKKAQSRRKSSNGQRA